MEKKQSSIDWLVEQFNLQNYLPHIEAAKEMHKEEMIKFAYKVLNESNDSFNGYVDEEKIYNETFGGEGEN